MVICAQDRNAQALLQPQIMAIQQAGYDVVLVCSDGPVIGELRAEGITVRPLTLLRRISPLADLKSVLGLMRLYRRMRIDIVHTHTPKAAFLAQIAARLAGVPIRVNTVHGFFFIAEKPGFRRWLFKKLEGLTCRLSTHVFSQSREDVELAIGQKLVAPRKLQWLGNGIDLDRFSSGRFSDQQRRQIRGELGIRPDAFVVGIVARMVREKGFLELFEAMRRLRPLAPTAHLLHVGWIDRSRDDEVTPAAAEAAGIGDCCTFLGQRRDLPALMTAMDCFCLPSHREGLPRSVIEAGAMGLPSVVTDVRGCREVVSDGVNGLIVPPGDVPALVEALHRLYRDQDLRARLGAAGRRRAEEAFDERCVFAMILDTYERLLWQRAAAAE